MGWAGFIWLDLIGWLKSKIDDRLLFIFEAWEGWRGECVSVERGRSSLCSILRSK